MQTLRTIVSAVREMIMRTGLRFALFGVAVLGAAVASADVTYNNYDSYFGYDAAVAWNVFGGGTGIGSQDFGEQFTASTSGSLQDIILPVSNLLGAGTYGVQLYSDNSGTLGTVLDSWTGVDTNGSFGSNNPSTLLGGSSAVSIVAGSSYWVVASPDNAPNSTLAATWNENDTGATGNIVYSSDFGATWNYASGETLAALQVNVIPSAAPEPLSIVALIGGTAALIRRRRR